ncbi:hypothetical protein LEM8419_02079 [Neolewinella maritima]|uniref:Uncharacterized protein n=1 Tax=Neolewinella maritima TaxID=1383882 RepID=A0ABN8F9I4_9BACT|nr:hypothetical protein [Neolewinella maritima]CAH1001174.1 hypothetical protein LEM8419_02079 [Neolewinella maritima]
MDIILRHGVGVVAEEMTFGSCYFVERLHDPGPRRIGKPREHPNRTTGYGRLLRHIERLHQNRALLNGAATPFRLVVVENAYTDGLLRYLADTPGPIGEIDLLTPAEVHLLLADLDYTPAEDTLPAERVARLSAERRPFDEWLASLA